jgi:hypothetical protein
MSDLTTFRDHARKMSTAEHKPECEGDPGCAWTYRPPCGFGTCGDGCKAPTTERPRPDPNCPGCVTDADRALWTRLADETDAYLARNVEEGLFA